MVAIRKFGEDERKTLPARLYFPQNFLVGVTTLCQSKQPHLLRSAMM